MESIVENRYLRHIGHQSVHGAKATKVPGIVNGGKVNQTFDAFLHLGSYDATLLE